MALLYLETNYFMGVATGRYPEAPDLLGALRGRATLVLPACCVMEALAALEAEQGRRNTLTAQIDYQISQLKGGVESTLVMGLVARLNQVRLDNDALVNDLQNRLFAAVGAIAPVASLIETTAAVVATSLADDLIDQPTDNLILHAIIAHASSPALAGQQRVFFTGNIGDYAVGDAGRALVGAGVKKFFRSYGSLKRWLASPAVR